MRNIDAAGIGGLEQYGDLLLRNPWNGEEACGGDLRLSIALFGVFTAAPCTSCIKHEAADASP
jgi:hypothetical protein